MRNKSPFSKSMEYGLMRYGLAALIAVLIRLAFLAMNITGKAAEKADEVEGMTRCVLPEPKLGKLSQP